MAVRRPSGWALSCLVAKLQVGPLLAKALTDHDEKAAHRYIVTEWHGTWAVMTASVQQFELACADCIGGLLVAQCHLKLATVY